jgi:hypothetical protein
MFHDDDYIGDDEFDDLMETSRIALQREATNRVNQNKDGKIKYLGDIVLVWDTSRLRDFPADEPNTDHLEHQLLTMYPSIVIADSQRFNADIVLGEDRVYPCNLDLVIWNKTLGKKFRTCSEFVKITDKGV